MTTQQQKVRKQQQRIDEEFKILSFSIIYSNSNRYYYYNIPSLLHLFLAEFSRMQNQLQHPIQHHHNAQISDLREIFSDPHIVQAYTEKYNPHLIFQPRRKNNHHQYSSNSIIIHQSSIEHYQKKQKSFAEDDFAGEFCSTEIVENYSMLDQKDQIYQSYDNAFKARQDKPLYVNENMLASSSENNQVPSRNSSLSSLSEKNHYINLKQKEYFLHDEILNKNKHKNHVKVPLITSRKQKSHYAKENSENQMDIQNSPNLIEAHAAINNNNKQSNFLMQNRTQNNHQFNNRRSIIFPQEKKITLNNFRRMDIDEEKEKRQKQLKIQKIQQLGCNCKKSKCLKMYCECFNLQIFCNQNCNCVGCCNQESNEDHKKAVLDALTRNPKAFNEVTQKLQSTFELGVQLAEVKKGCKCKKTKCQKKYCECFNIGEKCGKFCKCQGCENC